MWAELKAMGPPELNLMQKTHPCNSRIAQKLGGLNFEKNTHISEERKVPSCTGKTPQV